MAPTRMPSASSWSASDGASTRSARLPTGRSRAARLLALAPVRGGIDDLRLRPLGGGHDLVLAALYLVEDHRLGDVLAGGVELDRAVEGGHVRLREGVAHLVLV